MKILLAEDDPNIAAIAKIALEQVGGHEVVHVADGEAALKAALEGDFDVILLDEMMPKMNGLLVCEEYLNQAVSPSPVIFLSARSQESDIQEFNRLSKGLIPKPFDPMTLASQVEAMLR